MNDKFSRQKAIDLLKNNEYEAKLVQYFEQVDNPQLKNQLNLTGSIGKITISGYITLIKSFLQIYEGENRELKDFCGALENNLENLLARSNLSQKIYQELEDKGYSYSNYISHQGTHANFIKFFKKDGNYYCTIYNAGAYIDAKQKKIATNKISKDERVTTQPLNNANLQSGQYFTYPALTYQMNKKYGIEKIVTEVVTESGQLSNNQISKKNKERFFDPILQGDNIVQSQKAGNCTTRCIREALRNNIPVETFRELHNFINYTPYSQMLENLGVSAAPNIIPQYQIPSTTQKVMDIIRQKVAAGYGNKSKELNKKLLDLVEVKINQDKNISNFMQSHEGVEFITNLLSKDILDSAMVKEKGKQIIKIDVTNFAHYERGFNFITKKILLENTAISFAKDNKLDEKLTKELWLKMLASSLKDIDLPLTPQLLNPVKGHLIKALHKNNKLKSDNLDQILQDWQLGCLTNNKENSSLLAKIIDWFKSKIGKKQDHNKDFENLLKNFRQAFTYDTNVDLMIKAPIFKGLLDNNKAQYNKLSTIELPINDNVIDYYSMLKKARNIPVEIKKSKNIFSKYLGVNYNAPSKNSVKPNYYKTKIELEKKLAPPKKNR